MIAVILVQGMLFWKYQRQVKDICRQLSFLMKHDSNMLITREMDFGGIGELADVLNEWLELKRREKKEYLKKEEMISDTYTNLSHDIRTPLTSLDGYFQLMEARNRFISAKAELVRVRLQVEMMMKLEKYYREGTFL